MRSFVVPYPSVDIQQVDVLYTIYFIVLPDNFKERLLHLSYEIIPNDDEFLVKQAVFDKHLKFEEDGLRGMKCVLENNVELVAFHFCPAIGAPDVRRNIIDRFIIEPEL